MGLTKDFVSRALTNIENPAGGGDLVTSGALLHVAACDDYASVRLQIEADELTLTQTAGQADQTIRRRAQAQGMPVTSIRFEFVNHAGEVIHRAGQSAPSPETKPQPTPAQAEATAQAQGKTNPNQPRQGDNPQDKAESLPGVKHVIAVGAGKGGVGKSSIAVNLAIGLARKRHAVGLLDGDIYGPSLPTMLGLDALDQNVLDGKLQPFNVHDIKAVTIGKMVDPDKPLIWRGPMAHGAFNQLTTRTDWGELDQLIIDLPPGTGDVPLTMAQSLRLTGAVIVCTPQKVAQDDAVRAVRMFQQLGIDILGVVENMSYFIGDDGKEYDIFGRGGAEQMAQRMGLPFLGSVPITMALRQNSDSGEPTKNFDPETAGGDQLPKALERLVQNLESQLALASMKQGSNRPTLNIS